MIDALRRHYNYWHRFNIRYKSRGHPKGEVVFYQKILATLLRLCNKKDRLKILDVACGRGRFLQEAKIWGFDPWGVDISDVAVGEARKLVGANIIQSNAEKLPFKSRSFDCVICIGSLEHFADQVKALQEMRRVLRRRGVAFFHLPNLMFLGYIYFAWKLGEMPFEGGQSFSENKFTFKGWQKLISQNGFKIIKYDKYNDIFASKRVQAWLKLFWQLILRRFVPFNLSYAFNVYAQKLK